MFHANYVNLHGCAIPADFAQFICARRIKLDTSFIDEQHRNNLVKFIMGAGNAPEKFCIYLTPKASPCGGHFQSNKESTRVPKQGEFCEFLVKVN
jgi:hypothetical protein